MSIEPRVYQALVIRHALEFYAKTGHRVNRAYTPKNMMSMASKITGKEFKAMDYLGAAEALREWIDEYVMPYIC